MTITIRKHCLGEGVMAYNLPLLCGSFILGGILYIMLNEHCFYKLSAIRCHNQLTANQYYHGYRTWVVIVIWCFFSPTVSLKFQHGALM